MKFLTFSGMKKKQGAQKYIHLWVPNLFEFKGGIQVYLQDVLRAIDTDLPNLAVSVFDKLDRKPPAELSLDNHSFFFSGKYTGFWQTLHFAANLVSAALIKRPSLIVCGHLNFAPVAFWIHRFTGIPYWIIVYGVDAWNVKNLWKKKALQAAHKVISISEYTRNRLTEEQKIHAQKIPLLPVTFDANRFYIAPKPDYLLKRYGLQANQPIILTVCRLASSDFYKGYDQIIRSLPEIRYHFPNLHYILVGKGDDRPRVEQLIAQLNLQECVTLAGFVSDQELCDHYNLCDVFAMPSKGEGFGIVYLEALACGKPTLGGNQDGAIDALCHGELGALIDPDDVGEIAKILIQILRGKYPNSMIYKPHILRSKVISYYGLQRFKQLLYHYLKDFFSAHQA
jgi:glycosyltransferase involved in cell wall biosynthesis